MVILHIETSTNVCSVAVSEHSNLLFSVSNDDGMNHAALLSGFVDQALKFIKTNNKKPDAVAVSSGPGSYTGLRIGVSTAKGLCYGLDIPLIAVSTLEVIATGALKQINDNENFLICPMIDARRMEVYAAFYNSKNEVYRNIMADIIDENSYSEILDQHKVYFAGNGAGKCKTTITHSNAKFVDNISPLAENMISIATKAYNEKRFEDIAYFEPFYLKEFQATTPKKNL